MVRLRQENVQSPGSPTRFAPSLHRPRDLLIDSRRNRRSKHPAQFLHKLPEELSNEHGALVDPLSVGYNAVRRASPYLGQPVVAAGARPIGLAVALNARAAGANPVVVTDLGAHRLAQARARNFKNSVCIDPSWDRLEG